MKKILFIIVLSFAIVRCTDIIEPNISNDKVILLSPTDSIKTIYSSQVFWWEEVVNAGFYNIQVVSPDFDNTERLIVDTLINTNKFNISLFPGKYQWRVKALNYSYETNYTVHTLFIDSTLDLSQQIVVLKSPINNDTNNFSSTELKWDYLYNADYYVVEVYDDIGLIVNDTVTSNNYSLELANDGNYYWKVKAVNSDSETIFFAYQFYTYTIPPQNPVLLSPSSGSIFISSEIINFSWENDQNSIPSLIDTFIISNDSTFNQISFETQTSNRKYDYQLETGTYYWRVKTQDKAGNKSEYSQYRSVIINDINR